MQSQLAPGKQTQGHLHCASQLYPRPSSREPGCHSKTKSFDSYYRWPAQGRDEGPEARGGTEAGVTSSMACSWSSCCCRISRCRCSSSSCRLMYSCHTEITQQSIHPGGTQLSHCEVTEHHSRRQSAMEDFCKGPARAASSLTYWRCSGTAGITLSSYPIQTFQGG